LQSPSFNLKIAISHWPGPLGNSYHFGVKSCFSIKPINEFLEKAESWMTDAFKNYPVAQDN
jgi:hypothetical protein